MRHDVPALKLTLAIREQAQALKLSNAAVEMTQADQRLAGNAGCVGAVAAHPVFLDHGHTLAEAVGRDGRNHPGNAGTDDDQVIIAGRVHKHALFFRAWTTRKVFHSGSASPQVPLRFCLSKRTGRV